MTTGLQRAHAVTGDPSIRRITHSKLTPEPNQAATATWLRSAAWTYHPVGTCRMGTDPDAGAVIDATGRVFGIHNLHVIDASIMPDVPSANTHIPTIMIAERLADHVNH